jgi:hypothetical protein
VPCPATTQVVKRNKCAEIGGQAIKKALYLHTCRSAVPQQSKAEELVQKERGSCQAVGASRREEGVVKKR